MSILKIKKLISLNSKLLYKVRKKILKNQEDLNILRGKIQKIEHNLKEIIKNKENIKK